MIALAAVFFTVVNGAAPQRYRLAVGDVSTYDINAPRDIVNKVKTEELAKEKAAALLPVVIADNRANIQMLNDAHETFEKLADVLVRVRERVVREALETPDDGYFTTIFRATDAVIFQNILSALDESELSDMVNPGNDVYLQRLKTIITEDVLVDLPSRQITLENLTQMRRESQDALQSKIGDRPWSAIGAAVLTKIYIPNSRIDQEATTTQKNAFIDRYQKEYPVTIAKDERILNKDDIVTADQFQVLKELNFIESEQGISILFYLGVLLITLALGALTVVLLRRFALPVFKNAVLVAITAIVVVLLCVVAWVVQEFLGEFAPFLLPVFIAPILLSILVGLETAVIVNAVMTFAFMVMFGGDATFAVMSFIGGSLAAFLAFQASQRRRLSMSGLLIGAINALLVVAMGILSKKGLEDLLNESGLVFLNGLLSMVLAIGLLPFFEGVFNVITPFKLLELADPNHPVIKRLLVEAPGTYHHSLMVGNLAEAATRSIGGNALLARVGAYFHDIGKLKRPNFFKENQLAENPHEKLTPNLSTLVITSHPRDGDELALKYHLPKAIRDIIVQHHGTTLVAYFYHKAKQQDKGEGVKADAFRYEGPLPNSKESAVVLLADSIEAAVRSMPDKSSGKIEGLLRKIIRDKLDDGQLNRCDLTLKDLGTIADSFMTVFSGVFHERIAYPEIAQYNAMDAIDNEIFNATVGRPLSEKVLPAESIVPLQAVEATGQESLLAKEEASETELTEDEPQRLE